MRLVLGTAQLGMPYGINNQIGQPPLDAARDIISEAWENGIIEFDTAQDYGNSESVLGNAFSDLKITEKARVISKLSPKTVTGDFSRIQEALNNSLSRLGVKKLYGLLLHDESQLDLWNKGLGDWLQAQKENGLIEGIGVSVYSPARALEALATKGIDLVQVPSNIIDRRFETAGVFDLAKKQKKHIYIRSIFLQGALLMAPGELPERVLFLREICKKVGGMANKLGLSTRDLCLLYALQKWPDAKIVVGVESSEQIRLNSRTVTRTTNPLPLDQIENELTVKDERMVNPALWGKGS